MKKSLLIEAFREFLEEKFDFLNSSTIFVDQDFSLVFHWNGVNFRTFNAPFLDITQREHHKGFIKQKVCMFVSDFTRHRGDIERIIEENLKVIRNVFIFTSFSEDTFETSFRKMDERYPEIQMNLKHITQNYCCVTKRLFLLPQVDYIPFIEIYSSDDGRLQKYEDLLPKTQRQIRELSKLLQDFVSSLKLGVDVFSIGSNSFLIGEWMKDLSLGQVERKGTLILIDRTVDMTAPYIQGDNLWDICVRESDEEEKPVETFLCHDLNEGRLDLLSAILSNPSKKIHRRLKTFLLHNKLKHECQISFDTKEIEGVSIEIQLERILECYKQNKKKIETEKKKTKSRRGGGGRKKNVEKEDDDIVPFYEGIIECMKRGSTSKSDSRKQCDGFKNMFLHSASFTDLDELLMTTIKNRPNLLEKEDIFDLLTLVHSYLPSTGHKQLFPRLEKAANFRKAREDRHIFHRLRRINAQRKGFETLRSLVKGAGEYECLVGQLMKYLCDHDNEVFDDIKDHSENYTENLLGKNLGKTVSSFFTWGAGKKKVVSEESSTLIVFFVGGVTGLEVKAIEDGFENLRSRLCPNLKQLFIGSTNWCSKFHLRRIIHHDEDNDDDT